MLEVVALVGLVARERVDAPLHQALHAVVMLHELQPLDRHLLALQVGEDLRFPRRERDLVTREVTHGVDAGVARTNKVSGECWKIVASTTTGSPLA